MGKKQVLETRNFDALSGRKAIEALCDYIEELEERRGKDLREKQTDAVIRIANELISSIKAQIRNSVEAERLNRNLVLHARVMRAHMRARVVVLREQLLAP